MTANFPVGPASRRPFSLADVVDGIGTEEFGARLVGFLHDMCGADHCAVFRLGSESITALAASSFDPTRPATPMVERYVREGFWRKDPALSIARSRLAECSASVIRLDLDDSGYSDLRPRVYPQVRDRILLCGRRDEVEFGLSIVRSQPNPAFGGEALQQLTHLADTLLAAMAKHVRVLMHAPDMAAALRELGEIENCFLARSKLPRRELEVCARVLLGLSTAGIALDLGVGEESVKTYRKRAYQRLGIATERELLHWYLAQWSAWRCRMHAPQRATLH